MVGWGVGKESWGIRYQKIFGDLLKEQVWADLDAFLLAGFQKKDGTVLHILSACMDSGGHFPDQVLLHPGPVGSGRCGPSGRAAATCRLSATHHQQPGEGAAVHPGRRRGKALLYQRLRHQTRDLTTPLPHQRGGGV